MKKEIIRITTEDTHKTYEFPSDGNPDLFEVKIRIRPIDSQGKILNIYAYTHTTGTIYVEKDTLLSAGLKPYNYKPKATDPEQTESFEDLFIRMLEHVGYYPSVEK